jgi:hypothetical protein
MIPGDNLNTIRVNVITQPGNEALSSSYSIPTIGINVEA